MVSLLSKIMTLLIGPFPNRFPIGPCPPLHGPSISPTKVLLGYLELFRLPLLYPLSLSFQWVPGHAKLPGNELADSFAKTGATLLLLRAQWPRPLQRLGTLATLFGDEISLTARSCARFLVGTGLSPSHPQ